MEKKTIVVGCDNAAVELKNIAKKVFESKGYTVEDLGVNSSDDGKFYPNVAASVAKEIIASGYTKEGALFCGTGIGMSITANKFPGIYAAVCHDSFSAERHRLSNNGNLICMGARVIGPELAKKILGEWCDLTFKGGPSADKVNTIKALEKELYK